MKNTKQKTAINVADMETVKSFITRLPAEWGKMSLYERLNFLRDGDFGSQKNDGGVQRQLTCNMEIWCECFGRDGSAMKPADSYAIGAIMGKIAGWEKVNRTTRKLCGSSSRIRVSGMRLHVCVRV